jgi:23S rRNA (uracil1939-C5)-methyltransferase
MARPRRVPENIVLTMTHLEERHTAGVTADGKAFHVRGAPVGGTIEARPEKKGHALRVRLLEPGPDAAVPACPVFGVCGGCQLQEMTLEAQRREKATLLQRLTATDRDPSIQFHGLRGAPSGYGYRNKVELSFGARRYQTEAERALSPDGRLPDSEGSFLGFHPPGWFAKVVPVESCAIATPAMQAVIARVSQLGLGPAWDTRTNQGIWRNLVIREGGTPHHPKLLVSLVTTSSVDPDDLRRVVDTLADLPTLTGILHIIHDGVAQVAHGSLAQVLWGDALLRVQLRELRLELPHDGFFQVNSEGALVLLDTIEEALAADLPPGPIAGTLLDLYCGSGALGLALSSRFSRVIGVELHAPSVEIARANAAKNGIVGEWHAGPCEEVLMGLSLPSPVTALVDPPRAGLHAKAARFLANLPADRLVYVACGPASLARDREILEEGGWRMTDLWGVDLFPQTHHIEAVARFSRTPRDC